MSFKIQQNFTNGLCDNCSQFFAFVDSKNNMRASCNNTMPATRLKNPVVRCSDFIDKRAPSLYEMRQIAWVLETNEKQEAVGFVKPKPRSNHDYD